MPIPPNAAWDIPFEIVDLTEEEKSRIRDEKDAEKRKKLEEELKLVYEGVRFRRRYESVPSLIGQESIEQASHPPPTGISTPEVNITLTAGPVSAAQQQGGGHS